MDELFEDFPQGLHIISFPAIERKNALLHCDLAHEIGHLPAEDFLQREPKDYLTDFRDFVSVQVNTDPDIQPLWKTWYIGERLNKSVHIRQRALEELISDTFAARAFGPAALFALMAIASGQRLDVEPDIRTDFYPPWRTRLRRMLQVLRQNNLLPASQSRSGGYSEELERSVRDHIARIEELTAEQTDQEVLEQDPYIKLAYESVFATLQRVDAFLTSEFETAFIRPDALYGQLYDLVDRLVEGITPNELTSGTYVGPAALEAILNAAWWYRIHFLPRLVPDSAPAKGPTLRVLNRLTLKAAELAYVQGEFMAWQATPRAQP